MFAKKRSNHAAAFIVAGLIIAMPATGGSSELSAQQANASGREATPRNGFHFSIGLGSASVSASCAECNAGFFDDRLNGLSGNIQLGGAVTSRLVIAAEFSGWMKNDAPIYRRIAALDLVVLGYPSENAGFFIKGGVGALRAIAEDDFIRFQTDAWTGQTGLGYDVPLGGVKLTPYANYVRSFGGATYFNGIDSPVVVLPNAIQFGMALTMH